MTITVNAKPFDLHSVERDQVILRDYTGESTDDAKLSYKRAAARPTKDFVGMEKGEVKLTVLDSVGKLAGIYTISTSVRADQLEADRAGNLATLAALAGHVSVINLVKEQKLPLQGN